jgi:hypothetical protein
MGFHSMRSVIFGLTAATLFAAGCGSDVELGGVTGRVTMDGKPLPEALVRYIPEGGGRSAQGRTDADGMYRLDYSAASEGALVGKSNVMITTGSIEDPRHRDEKVPLKYNYETTLTADVTSGDNEINFDLQSK